MDKRQFNASDIVFANLVKQGREIVSMKFTGVGSIADIVNYLRRKLNANLGAVVIKVRNYTQGWSFSQKLVMREMPLPQGTQLTLF